MILYNTKQEIIQRTQRLFFDIEDGVYIVGRNKYGLSIIKLLKFFGKNLIGFLDDYYSSSEYEGFPVFKSSEVVQGRVIINCVVEGRTFDVQCWIESLGSKICPDYCALQQVFPDLLEPIDFLDQTDFELIQKELCALQQIYTKLGDNQSKIEFENVLNFRYNRDIQFMRYFSLRLEEQYFEPFLELDNHPVFIDGGGFNGQTSIAFSHRYPAYAAIHYFEPSPEFFAVSSTALQPLHSIHLHNSGLWNTAGYLHFNPLLSSASRLEADGIMRVATTTIDQAVTGRVSFIKLDIEGAEKEAIEGAQHTIKKYKPNLAVCVYHNQADFTLIPELILSYRPDYKVYFRHYTQGVFESVMYFV